MSEYFIKTVAISDQTEAAKELNAKETDVFQIINAEGIKWGTYTNDEAPDWSDKMVHARVSKRHIDAIQYDVKAFKKSHADAEFFVVMQQFMLHLFYKGLGDEAVEALAKTLERYSWG